MSDPIQPLLATKTTGELLNLADKHIGDLCAKRKRWTMCVPVQWDDSDILISGALRRARDDLAAAETEMADLRRHREAAKKELYERRAELSRIPENLVMATDEIAELKEQLAAAQATIDKWRYVFSDLEKKHDEAQATIAGQGEQIKMRAEMCEDRWNNLMKAEQALSRAGWVRCDDGSWKGSVRTFTRAEVDAETKPLHQRIEELAALIRHCQIHSGYSDCGRQQMTTAQKRTYDNIVCMTDHVKPTAPESAGKAGQERIREAVSFIEWHFILPGIERRVVISQRRDGPFAEGPIGGPGQYYVSTQTFSGSWRHDAGSSRGGYRSFAPAKAVADQGALEIAPDPPTDARGGE